MFEKRLHVPKDNICVIDTEKNKTLLCCQSPDDPYRDYPVHEMDRVNKPDVPKATFGTILQEGTML